MPIPCLVVKGRKRINRCETNHPDVITKKVLTSGHVLITTLHGADLKEMCLFIAARSSLPAFIPAGLSPIAKGKMGERGLSSCSAPGLVFLLVASSSDVM